MRSRLVASAVVVFYSIVTLWAVPTGGVVGCGVTSTEGDGGGGDGGGGTTDPSTLSFSELMDQSNELHSTLTSDLSDYIAQDQNLLQIAADSTNSSSTMISAANDYIDAAEIFEDSLNTYSDFVAEYDSRLSSAASLGVAKNQGIGSPDALLPIQLGQAVTDCKAKVAECEAMTDEIDKQQCLQALNLKCPSKVVRIGASAIFGAGASTITGLALGSAALTLTGVGAIVAVGVLAGVFFDYCTSSGSLTVKDASSFAGTCAVASRQVTLGAGGSGATSLPTGGPGTIRVHIPGCAPVVFSGVTVGSSGLNLSVKCVPTDTSTTSEASGAQDDSSETDGAVDPGTGTCGTVASVFVNPNPTDPAPDQSLTVTVSVFPVASGCTVSYSLSGTDGYALSGTPTTDSNGTISFGVEGGAEGVVDTVVVNSNSVSSTIAYSF